MYDETSTSKLLSLVLEHGILEAESAENPFNIFAFLIRKKQKELIPLITKKGVKIDVQKIFEALKNAPGKEREEWLAAINPDQASKAQIAVELIKQRFQDLLSKGSIAIHSNVDQKALVESIKKCVESFGADLATKVSFQSLKVYGLEAHTWNQSLYYHLMVLLMPSLKEEQQPALGVVCEEWLKKQNPEVRKEIINETNPRGQTALLAALDVSSSLETVVYFLAKAGIDPLAKAKECYIFKGENLSSLDGLKECRIAAAIDAFDKGRKEAGLETYAELVASLQSQGAKPVSEIPKSSVVAEGDSGDASPPDVADSEPLDVQTGPSSDTGLSKDNPIPSPKDSAPEYTSPLSSVKPRQDTPSSSSVQSQKDTPPLNSSTMKPGTEVRSGLPSSGSSPQSDKGNMLTSDTTSSTSNAANKKGSELLSPGVRNALIGVAVATSLVGLFYGVRHVMKKDNPFGPHDGESIDLAVVH